MSNVCKMLVCLVVIHKRTEIKTQRGKYISAVRLSGEIQQFHPKPLLQEYKAYTCYVLQAGLPGPVKTKTRVKKMLKPGTAEAETSPRYLTSTFIQIYKSIFKVNTESLFREVSTLIDENVYKSI